MHPMLNVAVRAARAAGRIITRASLDLESVKVASKQRNDFVTEVHIVNGLNPDLPFSYYTDLLRALKAERPDLHIKGFTAVVPITSLVVGLSTSGCPGRSPCASPSRLPLT